MDIGRNIEELQKVADYRLVRKNFKWAAISSIIFGLIAMGTGFGYAEESPLNVILGLIGTFLLAEGIWLIRTSNPKGMIIDGIALCILGVWNITVTIAGGGGGGVGRFFFILGIWQIVSGVQSFRRYRRFSGVSPQKPSEQVMKQVDDIVKSVTKTKLSESEDIIEFQMGKKRDLSAWKGKLTGDVGVFATSSGDDVLFARRNEVDFTSVGEVVPKKARKVSVQIGKRTFDGKISPESMERYESWKGAVTMPAKAEAVGRTKS